MGNRGRFGKYGEIKRFKRLRQSKTASLLPKRGPVSTPGRARRPSRVKTAGRDQGTVVTFRKGGPADKDFIARLSREVFSVFGSYEEIIPKWLMYETIMTIVACLDDRSVGFAMLGDPFNRYDLPRVTELLAIAVDPEKHRSGIGESLLGEVDKKAAELRVRRIFLHTATTNLPARSLFAKAGYRPWEIKRSFYPEGQDAIVMSKEPLE